MKLKDLIPKLQALNPEAEVYVEGGQGLDGEGPQPCRSIRGAVLKRISKWSSYVDGEDDATPSDTLIVLSE